MTAEVPFRPRTPREESAWWGIWPEKRNDLNFAWVQLLPLARATERRRKR